jgi:hypothetical protein
MIRATSSSALAAAPPTIMRLALRRRSPAGRLTRLRVAETVPLEPMRSSLRRRDVFEQLEKSASYANRDSRGAVNRCGDALYGLNFSFAEMRYGCLYAGVGADV